MLKRKQIEQIEQGTIKRIDGYIIVYHQLIQNGGLLPLLIPLADWIGKAPLTSGAAALGTLAGKKFFDKNKKF